MKSHGPSLRTHDSAFTLVELLVVIVIIAVLASLAIPVTNVVMNRTNTLRLKTTMKDLIVAISNYRAEYNRYPLSPTELSNSADTDAEQFRTDGTGDPDMINILMAQTEPGKVPNLNSRYIKYIDLPLAKNNLFGIIKSTGGGGDTEGAPMKLVDVWGRPYYIRFDTNYDNRIENPDTKNNNQLISSKAPRYISASVIIWSSGPDKIALTKDDVTSWR